MGLEDVGIFTVTVVGVGVIGGARVDNVTGGGAV
jgi:hypothetical protein